MRTVRCPTSSSVEIDAVMEALAVVWPNETVDLQSLPVELQSRPDRVVNAQPEGFTQTTSYARERLQEMCRLHGPTPDLDISIESGAIDNLDVAVVIITDVDGNETIWTSEGVAFPPGTLELARMSGFATTTVGDIIHERWPDIPSDDWQAHFPPYLSRQELIRDTIIRGLDAPLIW